MTLLARIIGNERHGIQKYFLGWNSSICAEQKIWRTCRKEEKSFGRRGVGTSARYFFSFFFFYWRLSFSTSRTLRRSSRCTGTGTGRLLLFFFFFCRRLWFPCSFLVLLILHRPLRRTVDLDVLVRSRTGTVVFVVPAAHGTGLVLTLLLLVLTLAGNQST